MGEDLNPTASHSRECYAQYIAQPIPLTGRTTPHVGRFPVAGLDVPLCPPAPRGVNLAFTRAKTIREADLAAKHCSGRSRPPKSLPPTPDEPRDANCGSEIHRQPPGGRDILVAAKIELAVGVRVFTVDG